ncbi:MlaD family protein [Rhodococcus artemisiae]|uniref:MCE family protein n=1 Tax=Rhodococcus artemisiae TaxID=714159 RepID=A0ABU7LAH0_9NOCA|nr:MCE family protein [Rhodococcus artemisiae]MEE2058556.1 MCE family protein [Rhodococcus artemisiae]
MKSLWHTSFRIVAFAAAMVVVLVMVLRTIEQPIGKDTGTYTAMFVDANGLHPGDDVRLYGVSVGKVTSLSLDGTQARVEFTVARDHSVSTSNRLAIRYQNLTGQRYLDVQDTGQPGAPLEPGSVIGTDHTVPSFDVTTLFNGLQPVLKELSPDELNKFTSSLLAVVEGEGSGIGPALDAIEDLSTYTVDRQEVISVLVRNLSVVSEQLDGKSGDAMTLITELTRLFQSLQEKLPGLISFAAQIPPILDPLDSMLASAGLEGAPHQPLNSLIAQAFSDAPAAVDALGILPGVLQTMAALTPSEGRLQCSNGEASLDREIAVLVSGQRITLCNAE